MTKSKIKLADFWRGRKWKEKLNLPREVLDVYLMAEFLGVEFTKEEIQTRNYIVDNFIARMRDRYPDLPIDTRDGGLPLDLAFKLNDIKGLSPAAKERAMKLLNKVLVDLKVKEAGFCPVCGMGLFKDEFEKGLCGYCQSQEQESIKNNTWKPLSNDPKDEGLFVKDWTKDRTVPEKPKKKKSKKPFMDGYATYDPDESGFGSPDEWRNSLKTGTRGKPSGKPPSLIEDDKPKHRRSISFDDEEESENG